ncbi:S9 family peptidase [Nostoc sp. CENA543]|uniref:alpha/beta hydrolase family protein n=1 Tax=Nostoc sp. CENA543 TaxID=1869241 RepID=UPI001CEF701F|nr:prolyl oligopeptidase family serine peptidase [Nostoc sp. CENA543]
MNKILFAILIGFLVISCDAPPQQKSQTTTPQQNTIRTGNTVDAFRPKADKGVTLTGARRGFQTKLIRRESASKIVPEPPTQLARIVYYDAKVGKLAAYISKPPQQGQRFPAIIWISGGDYNTIDDGFFRDAPPENDQTASAFPQAGIVIMYPSLRGGNNNPGVREGFFGEVDDVLAAADYLAKQDFVDPQRIYLGGHSTGGTLALLVAESTQRFRAIFSFGPVEDVRNYDDEYLPFDQSNEQEFELRAPQRWLQSIQRPVFVFEGDEQPGNSDSLRSLARNSRNPLVQFHLVKGANHFSVLSPTTQLLAKKILQDDKSSTKITITETELNQLLTK